MAPYRTSQSLRLRSVVGVWVHEIPRRGMTYPVVGSRVGLFVFIVELGIVVTVKYELAIIGYWVKDLGAGSRVSFDAQLSHLV